MSTRDRTMLADSREQWSFEDLRDDVRKSLELERKTSEQERKCSELDRCSCVPVAPATPIDSPSTPDSANARGPDPRLLFPEDIFKSPTGSRRNSFDLRAHSPLRDVSTDDSYIRGTLSREAIEAVASNDSYAPSPNCLPTNTARQGCA